MKHCTPFFSLTYAIDCLDLYGESKTKRLLETAFDYYNRKTELTHIRTGPSNDGWYMNKKIYAMCSRCGYFMTLDPTINDICPCGNLYKDNQAGRFGARTGDNTIELYKETNSIKNEKKEMKNNLMIMFICCFIGTVIFFSIAIGLGMNSEMVFLFSVFGLTLGLFMTDRFKKK